MTGATESDSNETLALQESKSLGVAADFQDTTPGSGYGLKRTVLLITSGVAGSGLIALPNALAKAGWTALVVMIVCLVATGYGGVLLGRCWSMLLERYPESRGHVRRPYPLIAEKAVGKWMGTVVTVIMCMTELAICVVYVVMVAENVESLLSEAGLNVSHCYWMVVLCAVLTPFSWLDTPKDFWWVGACGTLTTVVAFILSFTAMSMDASEGKEGTPVTNPSAKGLFLAFGNILFGAAGSSFFPTLQHDMREPQRFPVAVVYAYLGTMILYLPTSIFGYYLYGRDLEDNLLLSLPHGGLRIGAEVAISAHAAFAFLIVLNPVTQAVEDAVKIGEDFSWKRAVVRTAFIVLILFIAETIPRFGPLLDLVGGSLMATLGFIAPTSFYVLLCSQKGNWTDRRLPLHIKVICIEIALVGVLLGGAATYSAILEILSPNTFVPPCYVNVDV